MASAVLSPATALRAEQALIHAVTNSAGLGLALAQAGIAELMDGIGTAVGEPGLAEQLAADAILMRISAVTYENPEIATHEGLDRLVELLAGGEQIEAAMLLTDLDLADLAPVLPELMALNALPVSYTHLTLPTIYSV